jgi:hypothetical protein
MCAEKKSGKPLIASVSVGLGDAPDVPEQARPTMRIVVVAEAGPDVDHGVADGAGGLVRVHDVDDAMAALQMRLVVDLDLPLVEGARERIELPIDSLRSLRPSGLVERVGALRALAEARRALSESGDEAKAARERALSSAPSGMQAAIRDLFQSSAPSPAAAISAAPSGKRTSIDDLFDRVEAGVPVSPAPTTAISAIAGSMVTSADPSLPGRIRRIDDAFSRLLSSLLANPEIKRLERVWRSIRLLREQAGEGVIVDLVTIPAHASADALDALAEHAAQSGEEIDLVVLDPGTSTTSADVARLEACAERAERLHAPLIASTTPAALGVDDLEALSRTQRRLGSPGDAKAAPLHAFMAKDAARWVCLALNGPLVSGPHRGNVAGVPFQQDKSAYVAAIPAFAVAALSARAFSRDGWPAPHEGPRHGMLADLAVKESDGSAVALEHAMPLESQKAAARAGVAVFGGAAGGDQAILAFAPIAYRGSTLVTGGDPPASLTLSDQFLVGRVARLLTDLAAEIPAGTAAKVVQEIAVTMFASAFPHGDRPRVDAASDGRSITIRVDASGWRGVTISNLELSAPLRG